MNPFSHIQYSFSMCDYVILTLDQMVKVLLASAAHRHHYFWLEAVDLLEHIRRERDTLPLGHICSIYTQGVESIQVLRIAAAFPCTKVIYRSVQSSIEVVLIRNQELHYR